MLKGMQNPMASLPAVQALMGQANIIVTARTVDFNSANTDTAFPIVLPAGFTRYRVAGLRISGASASLTTATCGLFTAAAAGGTAIVTSGSTITVSTASEATNNNAQQFTINNQNTITHNAATLYFRVQNPQGSAATGNVALIIEPLS